ncbi:MAG: AAA family ATPase [Ardenticatenales bacterium]|nr:AAA family ATPase [Ardenticatenales bacterium]
MLENVHITNFRLFKDFSIGDLARVNLIVGKNNAGKSSLLEAVFLLVSQDSFDVLFQILEMRGEISFVGSSRRRAYEVAHIFSGHALQDGASIRLVNWKILCAF